MPIDPTLALNAQGVQIPNISQSVMQGQQMALQRQAMLQMQQERAAQTQEIQQKAAAAQLVAQHDAAMDQIMKSAYTPDPDTGAMLLDTNKIQQGVIGANMGHLWPQMSESIDKMNQSMLAANAKRRETLAAGLNALDQTPDELKPQAAQTVLAGFRANNLMTPDHVATALQQLGPNPTAADVHNLVQKFGAPMPEFQTLVTARQKAQADLGETQAKTQQALAAAAKDNVSAGQITRQQEISNLAAAPNQQAYAAVYAKLPPASQQNYPPPQAWTPKTSQGLMMMGLTPEQASQRQLGWAQLAETAKKNAAELAMMDPSSPKNQERMEQQGAQLLKSELMPSSRSGMGTEDKKVNQAIHLLAMFDQNRDAQGNYNIPKAQYAELATGLATLVSPNAAPTDSMRSEIETRTAAGDFNNLMTYVTGTPLNGSTQDVYKMLRDSIVRQGTVAQQNRSTIANSLQSLMPSDLDPNRRARILSGVQFNTMPGARIAVKGPNGQTGTVDANEPLPPGWSKQ